MIYLYLSTSNYKSEYTPVIKARVDEICFVVL
jgi:hypothetical protein